MNTNLSASRRSLIRLNLRLAKELYSEEINRTQLAALRDLTKRLGFCLARGDVQLLESKWYVTHSGLLSLAQRNRCTGIRVQQVREFCDPAANRWIFKATVYKSPGSKGFVGYGDADPSNVSPLVRGAEMRVAETRSVNRALRKAYGIGLCSVEELGKLAGIASPAGHAENGKKPTPSGQGRLGNGQPRLRDRLCLLIRQHQLDPTLVKRYAAEFCGTSELRDASRQLVEEFIHHLAEWAARDLDGLRCKLNSYAQPEEVKS